MTRRTWITCSTAALIIFSLALLRDGRITDPTQFRRTPFGGECRAMFEIGELREMATRTYDVYQKYKSQLPSLVHKGHGGQPPVIINSSRLQLLGTKVPYIPCEIHEYSDSDLLKCSASRAASGRTFWIALVGDSQMRLKIHFLLSVLPKELTYTFAMDGKPVSFAYFEDAFVSHNTHPPTFDIIGRHPLPKSDRQDSTDSLFDIGPLDIGSYVLRVTLAWAPLGSKAGHPLDRKLTPSTTLQEWAAAESIPDVIVVGYGLWFMLLKESEGELSSFTTSAKLTKPLLEPLTVLASRTDVMLWAQSRFRRFNWESNVNRTWKGWKANIYWYQFDGSIPFLDELLWDMLRPTGMWRWDTFLPFNLASLDECRLLQEANMSKDAFYRTRWWNCRDSFHTAYKTNRDEMLLLMNLLCNAFLMPGSRHCCS